MWHTNESDRSSQSSKIERNILPQGDSPTLSEADILGDEWGGTDEDEHRMVTNETSTRIKICSLKPFSIWQATTSKFYHC